MRVAAIIRARADLRVAVDAPEDRSYAARTYNQLALRAGFGYEDALAPLARKPGAINAGVPRKMVPG